MTRLFVSILLSWALCFTADVFAQSSPDPREEKRYSLSIKSQGLAEALSELIVALDVQIVARSELLEGKTSPALMGEYTVEAAIEALLAGSDLDYNFISRDAIIVFQTEPASTVAEKSAPAAQTSSEDPENATFESVIVTGSRVPRSQFSLPYPTQAIDPLYLERGSYSTLSDAINSMPLMCEPRYSLNSPSSNGNIGESYGDLYCLGSQRTLTLINGRRSISSNEPSVFNAEPGLQVDLNMIPRLMIKNVDVIGVGSAPVYGSDAIAGTINILLKDRFNGFEMDIQYGESSYNDDEQINIGFIAGADFNFAAGGNITFGYEYHDQEGILADQRAYTQFDRDYIFITPDANDPQALNFRFANDVVDPTRTAAGIPTPSGIGPPRFATAENGYFISQDRALTFNNGGRLSVFERGELSRNLFQRDGGDGVRESLYRQLRVPLERHAAALNTFLEFNSAFAIFSELEFYQNQSSSFSDIGEVVSISQNRVYTSLPSDLDSPFLDPDDRLILDTLGTSLDTFYLHKDWRMLVDPRAYSDSQVLRGVIGARGEFSFLQRFWDWELSYSAGKSESEIRKTRIHTANFEDATTSLSFDSDGEFICLSEAFCGPFDPFGVNYSQAAIDFLTENIFERGETQQSVFTLSATTELMQLAGGEWLVVLGAEQRREKAEFFRSDYNDPRISDDINLNDGFSSEFDTREFFFESVAPVLGDDTLSFVDKLELEANWRGVDHSSAGNDNTWALGGRLHFPLGEGGLQLRANRTHSIRSPSLFELSRPFTAVQSDLNDPCDKDNILLGPDPDTRVSNCILEAASRNFVYDADTFDSLVPDVNPLRLGGTPNLKNEQAKAYTLGLVYNARSDEGLQFSLDLIDIAIDDAIIERELNLLAAQCYDASNASSCADIIRDAKTFQIIAITNAYENIGRINLSALQYNVLWQKDVAQSSALGGRFSLNVNAYQLREYREENRVSSVDRRGFYKFPDWRAYASASYALQDFEFTWMTHYTSAVDIELPFDSTGSPEVEAYFLHHMQLAYQVNGLLGLRFGVRNVLDSDPPEGLPSKNVGNVYDARGRYYSVGVNLSF